MIELPLIEAVERLKQSVSFCKEEDRHFLFDLIKKYECEIDLINNKHQFVHNIHKNEISLVYGSVLKTLKKYFPSLESPEFCDCPSDYSTICEECKRYSYDYDEWQKMSELLSNNVKNTKFSDRLINQKVYISRLKDGCEGLKQQSIELLLSEFRKEFFEKNKEFTKKYSLNLLTKSKNYEKD